MLGQYMSGIGYGAYETDAGMGFAFNGLSNFGSLPTPVLNALFAPEKIKEGEFQGATLSRGFQIIKEGEKYFIVPQGSDYIEDLASKLTGGGVIGKLVGAAAGAVSNTAGELSGIRVELLNKNAPLSQQTSIGGTLIYKPAGMNMLLIAAAVGVALLLGLYFMTKN